MIAPYTPAKPHKVAQYTPSTPRNPVFSGTPEFLCTPVPAYGSPSRQSLSPSSSPSRMVVSMTPLAYPCKKATTMDKGQPISPIKPPRIPMCSSLDDVITYWEKGHEERGLTVPLKLWRTRWDASEYRSEAAKLSNIKQIYDEYKYSCKGDDEIFEASYPGLRHGFKYLLIAVRAARIDRGDAKARRRTTRKSRL